MAVTAAYGLAGIPFPEREYKGLCGHGHRKYLRLRSLEPLTTWPCHVEHCGWVMALLLLPRVRTQQDGPLG